MIKFLLPLFLLSFTGLAQTTSPWKTANEAVYSIQYPSGWQFNKSGQMGTTMILFAPLDSDEDAFRENVNLLIQDLEGMNIDLDAYAKLSEEQVKTIINSKVIESKRMKSGTQEYHKIVYNGDQGDFHLTFEQYYFVIKEKAYILTFTTEQTTFASYKETGERILNSFILKK